MRSCLLFAILMCLGGCATFGTGVSPDGRDCAFASPFKGTPVWVLKGDESSRYIETSAAIGTPFYAVESGKVVDMEVSDSLYMSGHITIQVTPDVSWHYHFGRGRPLVESGQRIQAGEQLGVVGESSGIRDPGLRLQRVRQVAGMLYYDDPRPFMDQAHACELGLPIPKSVTIARRLGSSGAPSASMAALSAAPKEAPKPAPQPPKVVVAPPPPPKAAAPSLPIVATPTPVRPVPAASPTVKRAVNRVDLLRAIAAMADRRAH